MRGAARGCWGGNDILLQAVTKLAAGSNRAGPFSHDDLYKAWVTDVETGAIEPPVPPGCEDAGLLISQSAFWDSLFALEEEGEIRRDGFDYWLPASTPMPS